MIRTAKTILVGALLASLGPASATAGGIDLRVGGFFPEADGNLFRDDEALYTRGDPGVGVRASDWRGITGGVELSASLADVLELGFHVDGYGRTLQTSLRDFVDESGREIRQSLKLEVVPLGVSLRLVPKGRERLAPYVAAGVDLYFWKYEEFGEFVDFAGELDIFDDAFFSEGVAPGFHVAVGLRIPLNHDFSLVAEGRYQSAKDDMGDDFRGSELDLSGASVTLGLHLAF